MAIPIYNEPIQSIKVYQIVYDYNYLGELFSTYTYTISLYKFSWRCEKEIITFSVANDLDGKVFTSMAANKPDVFIQQGFDCIIKSV